MATFLFKTEPSEYAFADLQRDGTTTWTGVSNASALIHLRTARKGDDVLIYHTGDERAIVGVARVVTAAYQDPKSPGLNDRGEPKAAVVDLKAIKPLPAPILLAAIKADPRFADFALVKLSRLSVMPVPPLIDRALRALGGL
jgi:predicted RNA-binding protein with PUA-like domain